MTCKEFMALPREIRFKLFEAAKEQLAKKKAASRANG